MNYYARHLSASKALAQKEDVTHQENLIRSGTDTEQGFGRGNVNQKRPPELAGASFVFANFNKIDKLEPLVFGLWMAVLRRASATFAAPRIVFSF